MIHLLISAAMIVMFSCSSCVALDQEVSKPLKPKPMTRVMAFTKRVHGAVTELARELAPTAKAVTDEVSSELRADLTKVREEVSLQMRRPMPSGANRNTP